MHANAELLRATAVGRTTELDSISFGSGHWPAPSCVPILQLASFRCGTGQRQLHLVNTPGIAQAMGDFLMDDDRSGSKEIGI